MENTNQNTMEYMPKRFKMPSLPAVIVTLIMVFLFWQGIKSTDMSLEKFIKSLEHLKNFISRAFPPDLERLHGDIISMYETFQMALVGTVFGVLLAFPMAILASKNTTPSRVLSIFIKAIIAIMRTIPDLVWALIFVICVGLGPLPGILTITVDICAYCGRMFCERIEEMPSGPMQALSATGASRMGVILGAVFPMGMPSFVATSLYSLEKSIRGATILGVVGAGGIGVRLNEAMKFRNFDRACTIIILILIVVLSTQYLSNKIRAKLI